MDALMDFLRALFNLQEFSPHGICLSWDPGLLWTHAISDFLIGTAYLSIPLVLACYVRAKPKFEYYWVIWCFVLFIMSCGLTHYVAIVSLWYPVYRIEAFFKIFTALASVSTAVALWPLLPRAIKIPTVGEYHYRELLLQELNHRVRNNLQIIEGTLRMQLKTVGEGDGREAVADALSRISTISRVHDQMYMAGSEFIRVAIRGVIVGMCEALSQQTSIPIDYEVEDFEVPVEDSVPIAQIVNELITNAAKYGRREGVEPRITVSLVRTVDNHWDLSVSDNGPGLRPGSDVRTPRSLGMRLIRTLSAQLGGELVVESTSQGTTFRVGGVSVAAEDRPRSTTPA